MSVDKTLERWRAEEAAVRARLLENDVTPREKLQAVSGAEFFAAVFAGELPPPPIAATLDIVAMSVERGHAVFQGRPQHKHYNPMGIIHGGWITTILDSAMGCAVHSTLPSGTGYTTLELKVNFVRAITDAVQLVRAEGRVVHGGRQVATAEGRLVGPDDKLYAHATTTCLIFDAARQ